MKTSKKNISDKIIIFSRYPVPGKTKTRLIPDLGAVGAADVHRKLAEKITAECKIVIGRKGFGLEICYTGGSAKQMRTWLGKGLSFIKQEKGDLGKRMFRAFERSFHEGCRKVVLIGTDIPAPIAGPVKKAFAALNDKDIVLGPAEDGGYWLVGMKSPFNIFEDIKWGKDTVLRQTLGEAEKRGLSVELLDIINDIDTVDDLTAWDPEGDWKNPYLSVIIPTLNEEEQIENAVKRAINTDSEIIVSDGGSRDNTVKKAEGLGVKVIQGPRGRAVQQNSGALVCKGNNLLFLHADTLLPSNYPELVFNTLLIERPAAGAFRFKTDMDNLLMRIIEFIANVRSQYFKLPYGDQAIFLSKEHFIKTGYFPNVPVAEDLYFIRKLKRIADIEIVPVPAVTSARRWKKTGILKTFLIHLIIMLGCFLSVKPAKLALIHKKNAR